MRDKVRYVVFEVITHSHSRIGFEELSSAVMESSLQLLGTLNLAKARIRVMPENCDDKRLIGIIKVNRKYLNHLRTAIALIKDINNKKVTFRTRVVTGTLKKAKSYISEKKDKTKDKMVSKNNKSTIKNKKQ